MIDKLLHFSLKQRLLVLLATAVLIVAGLWAMNRLPVDAFPDVTNVQVQILTQAGGMAPTEVEQLITFPIETTMAGLPRLHEVRSLSKIGLSVITVVFEDGVDTYFARQQVFERLQQAADRLPKGVEPQMGPITTGLGEIYQYILSSDGSQDVRELRSLQDWIVRPILRTVPGVTDVNSFGGQVKQYQILVDPARLKSRGLTLRTVFEAVEKNNANVGAGNIEHREQQYIVRGIGLARGVDDLKRVVVSSRGGTPVLLSDVAEIAVGDEPRQGATTYDGKGESVAGIVMMLKGASGKEVVSAVKEKVPMIQKALPKGVTLLPYYDRTQLVQKTIDTVRNNLVEGGFLVAAVLFYFLGNVRGALIVAAVIPLSMLFSFLGMKWLGLSANLMTLGAIDFGMIVDGSVVMVENTVRHLAERKDERNRLHVIYESAREVARPILFGVFIIVIVYLPIVTLTDMEGKMFSPMAFTVGFALLGSLLLTLTLVPTLCSFLLKGRVEEKDPELLVKIREAYIPFLIDNLRRPKKTLLITAACFVFSLVLIPFLGTEFLPTLDEGSITVQSFRLPSVSVGDTVRTSADVEKAIRSFPEVERVVSRAGRAEIASDPMGIEISDIFVSLKPRSEWKTAETKEELVDAMRERLEKIPGMSFSFSQPIALRVDELISGVKSQVAVKLFGEDMNILKEKGEEIASVLKSVEGAEDVQVEKVSGLAYLQVEIDREKTARYGIGVSDINEALETAAGGKPVSEIFEGQKRFNVAVRLPGSAAGGPENLGELLVSAPGGERIPLKQLARVATEEGPAQISRENGSRRIVVECNVSGRDMGGFVAAAQKAIESRVKLPPGYYLTWGGQFENQQRAMARLAVILPICLALIFILLFSTFGSLRQASLIILNVPFALIGGVMALFLRGLPLSVSGAVGFIALFGVAVLNGIVMVSYFNRLREEGLSLDDAIVKGAEVRLRPVLMTALVASLGFIPMAFSHGTGAEVQRPLATVVIGGLVTSTLLTMVVLPTLYRWLEKKSIDNEIES